MWAVVEREREDLGRLLGLQRYHCYSSVGTLTSRPGLGVYRSRIREG